MCIRLGVLIASSTAVSLVFLPQLPECYFIKFPSADLTENFQHKKKTGKWDIFLCICCTHYCSILKRHFSGLMVAKFVKMDPITFCLS